MDLKQAMAFLHQTSWMGSRLGLERISNFLHGLGDPQNALKFVHIAGTNGKGSTAAMLEAVLRAAGYRTGLYTSPHLLRFNERIRVNGEEITDAELISLSEELVPYVDAAEEKPTEFELVTALAFLHFQKCGCDIVVLEVGLGGRLDATNAISACELAVITNIDFDHTEVLGDTLTKIAREKAGIIKKHTPVLLSGQTEEATKAVTAVCEALEAPLTVTDAASLLPLTAGMDGQRFHYRARKDLHLSLLGAYQLRNAATALDAADILREKGWNIPEKAIYEGLQNAVWPGRFEVLSHAPAVVVDGAHNPDGVRSLVESLDLYFAGRKMTVVTGVMADKDYETIISELAPYAKRFIAVTPDNKRALPSTRYKEMIENVFGGEVIDGETIKNGLSIALKLSTANDAILVCGSLYMVGEVREFFGKH